MMAPLMARLEEIAAQRRARIAAGLNDMGVTATVEGEEVRASAPGLQGRWAGDLSLRAMFRDGTGRNGA
ncbi:hypothetical protein [Sphingobium sp.]|uniref:hypothetical protein n=1 Tax=Sphingobium sp. TaxID=1912891 RepID=UPI003B3BD1AF